MSKLTMTVTVIAVLALAGCATDREPNSVRTGPQIENPVANSPGGKTQRDANGNEANLNETAVVDDSQARIDGFAAGAASIVMTNFR